MRLRVLQHGILPVLTPEAHAFYTGYTPAAEKAGKILYMN